MNGDENLSTLMSPSKLAQYLGVAERTINQWAASGRLPAIRIGSSWRFRRHEIDLWCEDNHTGPIYDESNLDRGPRASTSIWKDEIDSIEGKKKVVAACSAYILEEIESASSDVTIIQLERFNEKFGTEIVAESIKVLASEKAIKKLGFTVNKNFKDEMLGRKKTVIQRR